MLECLIFHSCLLKFRVGIQHIHSLLIHSFLHARFYRQISLSNRFWTVTIWFVSDSSSLISLIIKYIHTKPILAPFSFLPRECYSYAIASLYYIVHVKKNLRDGYCKVWSWSFVHSIERCLKLSAINIGWNNNSIEARISKWDFDKRKKELSFPIYLSKHSYYI